MLKCVKCGHEWLPRSSKMPKACPKCKHYDWNKTPGEVEHEKVDEQSTSSIKEGGIT